MPVGPAGGAALLLADGRPWVQDRAEDARPEPGHADVDQRPPSHLQPHVPDGRADDRRLERGATTAAVATPLVSPAAVMSRSGTGWARHVCTMVERGGLPCV